jgi:DNA-binding MarR family transcriptional regulator
MATTNKAAVPDDADQGGLVDALVQSSFATMAVLNRVGAEHDLSLTQLRVLAILRDRRLQMTALAHYLGLDKSTMTGLVQRAERRGLLQRAANPADGRVVDVLLTRAGEELTDRIHQHVAQSLSPMIGALSQPDQRRLQTLLFRLLGDRQGSTAVSATARSSR